MSGSGSEEDPGRTSAPRLRAAAPPEEELGKEKPAYLPRIPWRWVGFVALLLGGGYFAYSTYEGRRADALRDAIVDTHTTQLGEIADRYGQFRRRLETWIVESAEAGEPERYVDPRLRISGLHAGEGLYLRIHADQATSADDIAMAASQMGQDAIARCLGINPASARGLFENGAFLLPDWLDDVREERGVMRLRVLDQQLASHIQVDVPVLASLMRAQYFLLVLEHGESRIESPVDVYLWDLREDRQLMRVRVQANGILLPVRIRLPGVEPGPPPEGRPGLFTGGAHDCSIAAQIKALTGEAPISVGEDLQRALEEDDEDEAGMAPEGDAPAEEGAPPEGAPAAEAPPSPSE